MVKKLFTFTFKTRVKHSVEEVALLKSEEDLLPADKVAAVETLVAKYSLVSAESRLADHERCSIKAAEWKTDQLYLTERNLLFTNNLSRKRGLSWRTEASE